jgi:hypothetical protein
MLKALFRLRSLSRPSARQLNNASAC